MTVLGVVVTEFALTSSRMPTPGTGDLDERMPSLVCGALVGCVIGGMFDQSLVWLKSRRNGSAAETDTAP